MRPDDPEVRDFLAASMNVRVAALSPQGRPFMTPLWFVCRAGNVYIPTGSGSLVVRYLRARPRTVLLFDAERHTDADRALRMHGRVTIHEALPSRSMLLRLARKYFLSSLARGLFPHVRRYSLIRRYYAQSQGAAVIEVVPEAVEFVPLPRTRKG